MCEAIVSDSLLGIARHIQPHQLCVKLARDSVLHIAQHIFLISSFTTCVQLVMIDQFLGNPNVIESPF